jgi:hypothetical protein
MTDSVCAVVSLPRTEEEDGSTEPPVTVRAYITTGKANNVVNALSGK